MYIYIYIPKGIREVHPKVSEMVMLMILMEEIQQLMKNRIFILLFMAGQPTPMVQGLFTIVVPLIRPY